MNVTPPEKRAITVWLADAPLTSLTNGELERRVKSRACAGVLLTWRSYKSALEKIAVVRAACDVLQNTYELTGFADGYVCCEMPAASDAPAIFRAAHHFVEQLARPNVMLMIPATPAGINAGRDLLFAGLNVNFKIYSLSQYELVLKTYLRTIEDRDIHFLPLAKVASVVCLDLPQLDGAVNDLLRRSGDAKQTAALKDKAAIAVAELIRQKYQRYFSGDSWGWLAGHGALQQRLVWRISGSQAAAYLNAVVASDTIVALPAELFENLARVDLSPRIDEENGSTAGAVLRDLGLLGIHIDEVGERLLC